MPEIRVLIVDEDESGRKALASILGAEGWQVHAVADAHQALARLRQGPWSLVLVSVTVSGLSGPLFELLKDLEEAGTGLRALFLVPLSENAAISPRLEQMKLPHSTKPIQLDDFLDQVSDLLVKAGSIRQPLRRVRELAAEVHHHPEPKEAEAAGGMFARRDAASDYTEEELQAFEEEEKRRHKGADEGDKPHE